MGRSAGSAARARLRVGVVGAGRVGERRALIARDYGTTPVVAVADLERGRAERVAALVGAPVATDDWREIVARDDVDLVVVATTHRSLAEVSAAALEAGKHVLCEKPLGRNAAEAHRAVEAAQTHERVLKTGFNHRHHPAIAEARRRLDAGEVGPLYLARCRYGHGGRPGYDREWRASHELAGGGELLDQGVHALDLFRWFLGDLTEAYGVVSTYFWDMAPLEDNAFALLRTAAGQTASLHASWTQWKNLFSLELVGRDGYLIVEGLGGSYGEETLRVGQRAPGGGPPRETTLPFPGQDVSWAAEWAELVDAIGEGRQPIGNGRDGWMALRLVEAIYDSSRTGRAVRLDR